MYTLKDNHVKEEVLGVNLKGQVAIVTGASRGIGYAIADRLSACGADLVCCSTTPSGSEKVARQLQEKYEGSTLALSGDVSDLSQVQEMVAKVLEAYGKIDILVNNAGITKDNLLLRMSEEEWSHVLDVNLTSVFNTTKAVLRPMLKKKFGRVINVTSVVGLMGNPGQANYAASKAGMIGFTKSIAKEVAHKGITCNAVAPGFIETDMIGSLPKEYLDNIIGMIPQRRLGSPNDVASLVAYLSSSDSTYITGQVINVDGGILM